MFSIVRPAPLSNNHSDRDAHAMNTGFAAHHSRLLRDAIQICHVHLLPRQEDIGEQQAF
jgi:hypothetical protein